MSEQPEAGEQTEAATSDPSLAAPSGRRHTTRFWVHYRMTDQMGVVYYGNYLELFELARSTMIREAGWRYSEMERDGFLLPVVRAEVEYLAPAHYDDELRIETWIERLNGRGIDFRYEIRRNDDPATICRGKTRHLVAGTDGKPRRLNAHWQERMQTLL
jgi:acyl-CoA thioester hydrolase